MTTEKIIRIEAKTNKGKKALEQHIKETNKPSLRTRLIWKTVGYSQKVISTLPVILEITSTHPQISNPHFLDAVLDVIKEALKLNGAEFQKDYSIEVR